MADWKRMAVAGLKRERAGLIAKLQPELDRIDRMIAEFGGAETKTAKTTVKRKGSKSRSEAMRKAWETRKAAKEAHNRTAARMSPGAAANLAEAAVG